MPPQKSECYEFSFYIWKLAFTTSKAMFSISTAERVSDSVVLIVNEEIHKGCSKFWQSFKILTCTQTFEKKQ